MVRIPTAEDLGIGDVETQRASSSYFSIRSANLSNVGLAQERQGRMLQDLGASFGDLSAEVARRRTATALREEQALLDEFEMNLINPREGVFSRTGSAASGVTNDVEAMFEGYLEEAEGRLRAIGSASGRSAVLNLVSGVRSRMYRRAAQFEMQQLEAARRAAAARSRSARATTAGHNFLDVDGRESALVAAAAEVEALGGDENEVRYATGEVWESAIDGARAAGEYEYASDLLQEGIERGQINPAFVPTLIGDLRGEVLEQRAEREATVALGLGSGMPLEAFTGTDPYEFVGTVMPSEMFNPPTETTQTVVAPGQGGTIEAPRVITRTEFVGPGDPSALDPRGEAYRHSGPTPERRAVEANVAALRQIDMEIDRRNMTRLGYTRDGLRAMIAYGGMENVTNYVVTGGVVNPTLSNGMTLSEVYQSYAATPGEQTTDGYQIAEEYFDTIEDPEVRERARERYRREVEADDYARQRTQDALFERSLSALDEFSRVEPDQMRATTFRDLFSVEELDAMGPQNRAILEERYERIRSGTVDRTDESAYNAARLRSVANPEEFARLDLEKEYGHLVGPSEMRTLTDLQMAALATIGEANADAEGEVRPLSLTRIRENIGGATVNLDDDERANIEALVSLYTTARLRAGEPMSPMDMYDYAVALRDNRISQGALIGRTDMTAERLVRLDMDGLPALLDQDDLRVNIIGSAGEVTEIHITPRMLAAQALAMERATGVPPRPSVVVSQLLYIETAAGSPDDLGGPRIATPPPRSPAGGGNPFGVPGPDSLGIPISP